MYKWSVTFVSQELRDFRFHENVCKWSNILWPAGCIHLFAHCIVTLSSLCRLIWRHWTSKMLIRYLLSSVCLRLSQSFQLPSIQHMGLCVFSLANFLIMIMIMCSCYYHQIRGMNINHCLGLGNETVVRAVCLTMCYQVFIVIYDHIT